MAPLGAATDACCAYALSLESADDTETVTLRCALHRTETQVGLADESYADRVDGWFTLHALCTHFVPQPHVA